MLLVLNSDCSTLCLKNVPPLTCYNIDIHDLIMITFGGSVTEKVRNQTMLCFPTSPIQRISFTLRKRKPRRQCTGALCMQHSPTVAVLLTSFLLNHAPTTAPSWMHWLQDLGSYTAAWIWVVSQKKIEEIKQLIEFWQCTNTAFEWKMQFSCFPFYQVVQKHKLFEVASKASFDCLLYR